MLSEYSAKTRVQKGAQLLDMILPGWEQKIDAQKLDMGSGCFCVLGQIYGTFASACDKLWPGDLFESVEHSIVYGFATWGLNSAYCYRELQDAWIVEIANRLFKDHQYENPTSSKRTRSTPAGTEVTVG